MELLNEIEKAFANEDSVTVFATDDNLVELVKTLEENHIYWGGDVSRASIKDILEYSNTHNPPGVNVLQNWPKSGRHSFLFLDATNRVRRHVIEFKSNDCPTIDSNKILEFLDM